MTNKLLISSVFKDRVKAQAEKMLKSSNSDEFSNDELITNGEAISQGIIAELGSEEIHTLMSFNSSKLDYIVLSSGQTPALPDTPYSGVLSNRAVIEPSLFVTAIHAMLNLYPVVYEGENDGRIVRHVVPAKKAKKAISSHGSHIAFGGHVDNPDLPFFDEGEKHSVAIPDNLSLYCLKQQYPVVSTDVIVIDDILNEMTADNISRLMQPVFTIERPASFTGYTDNFVSNVPLIARNNLGQYISRFDTHRVTTYDQGAAVALDEFRDIGGRDEMKMKLALEQGDLLLFKNKRTLHARNSFSPRFDGHDRWLLRVFSMNAKPPADVLVTPEDPAHIKTEINAFNMQ